MKMTVLFACAIAGLLAVVGCSSASDEMEGSADDVRTLPSMVFTVGFDQEYPPYGYIGDDGEYTGFDLDLAREVCERNEWQFVATPIDWDAKDAELNSGAITCIWNGFTIEGREGKYDFSEPYMLNEQVVVVKAGSDIKTLEDLSGKTVVTQADSAALEVLQGDKKDLAGTFAQLDTIGDYNTAFMQLESGAVDAVACDLSIASYQMSKNADKYAQLGTLSSEHYGVGFALGNADLADTVNKTLREMVADGTVEALCEKYADQGISYSNWVLK
ncbi:MAG: transporter substrate-binding domain-containing protein [Eggerthellaceae bacterium]|nr:transporter substrate-binding domain-containing protein [Eggerthellaceae bacterium]